MRLGLPQPPGATPPRDGDKTDIDDCAQINVDAALNEWAPLPDVSGDTAPYDENGGCTMHIQQWEDNDSGGGGPFDPPPGTSLSYSVEITMWDNARTHKIGFLSRAKAPLQMTSKLDSLFGVDPGKTGDPLLFTLGGAVWSSDDGSCSVGGWVSDEYGFCPRPIY